MVAQRMGSQGVGEGDSNGGVKIQAQIQSQDPKTDPLGRQGSLYSLTLDEVQNQLGDLGKPLSSMNLDELLKTVWTADANNNQATETVGIGPGPDQPETGSSSNPDMLPVELSKKTVDEVWQDIQQGHSRDSSLDRKATLGEMTLEDFLVKAGVVAEGNKNSETVNPVGLPQEVQWMSYLQQQNMGAPVFVPGHHLVQHPIPIGGNGITDSSSPPMGTLSDTPGSKRVPPDEIAEKSVERRQKRMIKNRESAARSRARKQAYTHELEIKISRLEEENERLRRQKELEKVLPSIPPPEPKQRLRRTSSAPV